MNAVEIRTEIWDEGDLIVNAEFVKLLRAQGLTSAEAFWRLSGKSVKKVLKERGTEKVMLVDGAGEKSVETYIKRYKPVGFREKIKCWTSLKPSCYDAYNEWDALLAFHRHNLPTMIPIAVGRCAEGTFTLTLGILDYQRSSELLPELAKTDFRRKRRLIAKIAELAGRAHKIGLGHQDFYLVHLFVLPNQDDDVFLIDLQRMIMKNPLPKRWIVKDLAQLLFSASGIVSKTDIWRFWLVYTDILTPNLRKNRSFINSVLSKATKIRDHDAKRRKKRAVV